VMMIMCICYDGYVYVVTGITDLWD